MGTKKGLCFTSRTMITDVVKESGSTISAVSDMEKPSDSALQTLWEGTVWINCCISYYERAISC